MKRGLMKALTATLGWAGIVAAVYGLWLIWHPLAYLAVAAVLLLFQHELSKREGN